MASTSGIPVLGDLQPGSHIGQFYWDQYDLLETLVPFFATGLRQRERCLWICAAPLCAADARNALTKSIPDLAELERIGDIAFRDYDEHDPDALIIDVLAAEQQALLDGFGGLRVATNTSWVTADRWRDYAELEARMHEAFRDRQIITLCSYPLSRCGSHQVVDVLNNHGSSLVRGSTGWQVVRSATAALLSVDHERFQNRVAHPHTVEFYQGEFPASRIADRLANVLSRGHAVAALVTREHASSLRRQFSARGLDVDALIGRDQLALLDADAVFELAWANPGLRIGVLDEHVLAPIAKMIRSYGRVVGFGELVDLIARRGDRDAAVALERWWNQQLALHPIELACGYSLSSFGDSAATHDFRAICAEHVHASMDDTLGSSETDLLRAELAQVTTALASEMAHRQVLEAAHASARDAREHLVLLNKLTGALGEVTTRAQFVDLVRESVMQTLSADSVAVVEIADTGETIPLVAHGVAAEALCLAADFVGSRSLWNEPAAMLRDPIELESFGLVPMTVGARRLGVLVLGYVERGDVGAAYRALAEDVARQLALALDRAISYERLECERERAESASRAKDEFLAMLGHELRNPLSPILTATQLMRLRGEDLLEKERTVIERQVRHMIRLVDDLLDVSRITRGKVELRRRTLEMAEIVAQAVELVSPALEERAHQLTIDVPSHGLVVHADLHRIAQVLANLLANAAKYTPHGGAIQLIAQATDTKVIVAVRDNGIGIDTQLLPHVFDHFVQGRQGIDRASGGLGLGLAIARTLVELHGGTIAARSKGTGHGSEFIVSLPRHAKARIARGSTHSGVFALPPPRPLSVLVVDDNEDAAFLFSEALRKLGHRVEVAHDGPSALSVARVNPPEIAFLDIGLPVMDGYELGRRLRELHAPGPKLVALTGYGHSSDRDRSREAGFELHLVKPVDLSTIQDALAKLITAAT